MKIAKVETFLCDAGWRPWVFVKVETDDGLVGWGECSDGRMPELSGRFEPISRANFGDIVRRVRRIGYRRGILYCVSGRP